MIVCLMEKGCFMGSIDIKSAYHHFAIDPSFTKWLKFRVNNQVYKHLSLPFGFKDSPRIFTKCIRQVLAKLRKNKILCSAYIDDFYIQGKSYEESKQSISKVESLLKSLGFEISEKSIREPVQILP